MSDLAPSAVIDPIELAAVRDMCRSKQAREIRVDAGVSLAELGRSIPASPSMVLRWETGQQMPRGQKAIRYLHQLRQLKRRRRAA